MTDLTYSCPQEANSSWEPNRRYFKHSLSPLMVMASTDTTSAQKRCNNKQPSIIWVDQTCHSNTLWKLIKCHINMNICYGHLKSISYHNCYEKLIPALRKYIKLIFSLVSYNSQFHFHVLLLECFNVLAAKKKQTLFSPGAMPSKISLSLP